MFNNTSLSSKTVLPMSEAEPRAEATYVRYGRCRPLIPVFLYLQVLDVLSTLIGFKYVNATELSPFIRLLMPTLGAPAAVMASKIVACALAAYCLYTGRRPLLQKITYAYAALVISNLVVILSAR